MGERKKEKGKEKEKKVEGEEERRRKRRAAAKNIVGDVGTFALKTGGVRLRKYQAEAARAIVESVVKRLGLTFVVIFPRQSGKNETQAQIETYLLAIYAESPAGREAEMVKVSPTWKPQSLNAMRRLERTLKRNLFTEGGWSKEQGYIYRVGSARIYFLSGNPQSNIVGTTASTLLECDEAQEILTGKWDKEIAPMAASTNATRVFWGTAWTSQTLLGREMRAAREAEERDGRRRVFLISAEEVAKEAPEYGKFVEEQVRRLGRNHPMVRTQYFSEEIKAEGGMFPAARRMLMQGEHCRQRERMSERVYALLIDVAGEDEGASDGLAAIGRAELNNPGRDATALTVVEIDVTRFNELRAPVYRAVDRRLWVGVKHTLLYGQLTALAEAWQARWMVMDATGVGAGLASFLSKAMPGRVIPYTFNAQTKSKLGWDFLSVIETGRFKDWAEMDEERRLFNLQMDFCEMEALPGPEKRLKWGVPEGRREAEGGEPVHDDLIMSAALCAVLDGQGWGRAESEVIEAVDPLRRKGW